MVIEGYPPARQLEVGDPRAVAAARPMRHATPFVSAVAFLAAAGFVLAYSLPGGAYDIATRQEYGIVIWWVLGAGFAFGLLPRARPGCSTLLLIGALLAYAAWTAI